MTHIKTSDVTVGKPIEVDFGKGMVSLTPDMPEYRRATEGYRKDFVSWLSGGQIGANV